MIELTLAVIGAATVLRWALAVYRALSATAREIPGDTEYQAVKVPHKSTVSSSAGSFSIRFNAARVNAWRLRFYPWPRHVPSTRSWCLHACVADPLARARFYLRARACSEKVDRLFRSEHASLSQRCRGIPLVFHLTPGEAADSIQREKAIASCLFYFCVLSLE